MKRLWVFIVCAFLMSAIAGCGTIKGLGDDISTVGKWLTRSSDNVTKDTVK